MNNKWEEDITLSKLKRVLVKKKPEPDKRKLTVSDHVN